MDHPCAVMVLKTVVDRKPAPRDSLWIGLLISIEAAFAAVGMEWVVLTNHHLQLAVSIQISDADRVRRTNSVDEMHLELLFPGPSGILQPAYGREPRFAHIVCPIDVFDGK